MRNYLLILLFATITYSCNENKVYEKHLDPDSELEWFANDTMVFEVDVADTSLSYQLLFALRFAQGFPLQSLKLEVQHLDPEGNERFQMHDIEVVEKSGGYNGEGMGDIWDLTQPLASSFRFRTKGVHTFRISHAAPVDPVPLVMEIGLIVEKTGN